MSIKSGVTDFIDTNEWVPVNQLPGWSSAIEYYVNRNGDVMSTKGGKQKLLKHIKTVKGYHKVTLQRRIGQLREKQVYVHQLVALAFKGSPPTPFGRTKGCTVIDHDDEDKSNNAVDNLNYTTHRGNNNKFPYGKFQKKPPKTAEEQKEFMERKRHLAKLRMRKCRQRKKDRQKALQ